MDTLLQVACETATKTNMVMVFGEITTSAKVDYEKVVRDTCREIGFTSDDVGLDADKCKVRSPSHAHDEALQCRHLHGFAHCTPLSAAQRCTDCPMEIPQPADLRALCSAVCDVTRCIHHIEHGLLSFAKPSQLHKY